MERWILQADIYRLEKQLAEASTLIEREKLNELLFNKTNQLRSALGLKPVSRKPPIPRPQSMLVDW